jgi:hypothetical protein
MDKEFQVAGSDYNDSLAGNVDGLKRANQSKGWDAKPLA